MSIKKIKKIIYRFKVKNENINFQLFFKENEKYSIFKNIKKISFFVIRSDLFDQLIVNLHHFIKESRY